MQTGATLKELRSIIDELTAKQETMQKNGDLQTAQLLADTLERLKRYLAEKEATHSCSK